MDWMVLGGDQRFAYLAALAKRSGQNVKAVGLERAEIAGIEHGMLREVGDAAAVVLPNPFARGVVWPLGHEKPELGELLGAISPGTQILMMGGSENCEALHALHSVTDLLKDESYALENAHMTAEGAICAVMRRAAFAFYKLDVLIIGFGRIGAALAKVLIGLGARVTVAARRENARARARMFGARAIAMEAIEGEIVSMRVIFSTPPDRVLGRDALSAIDKEAYLVELASPPYGFDMEEAKSLGVNAWLEAALPGRYCPESAGAALYRCVMASLKGEGGAL